MFFHRAYEFLVYLEGISGFDLFSDRLVRDDTLIRKPMYMDLTRVWRGSGSINMTGYIHEDWTSETIDLNSSTRLGRSLVNGAACGNGILRDDRSRRGYSGPVSCRWGCGVIETLDHVLLHCSCYPVQRSAMCDVCVREGVDFTVRNLMTHPGLLHHVENFFLAIYGNRPS